MEKESTLKDSIIEISTHGNRYNIMRFLQAVAQCNRITYTNEINELDVKMNLILNYKDRFESKLKLNLRLLNAGKRKLKELSDMLAPKLQKVKSRKKSMKQGLTKKSMGQKLTKQQREKIMQEMKMTHQKSSLLLEEINNINRIHELLDDMNFENKEKLNNIKREMERKQIEEAR